MYSMCISFPTLLHLFTKRSGRKQPRMCWLVLALILTDEGVNAQRPRLNKATFYNNTGTTSQCGWVVVPGKIHSVLNLLRRPTTLEAVDPLPPFFYDRV